MSNPSAIHLPGPRTARAMRPAAAVEAVAPTGSDDRFAARREANTAKPERRNLPALIAAPRVEAGAPNRAAGSLPYLVQHIAQEILGPSRMALDLRFHHHPGFDAYSAMQGAEPDMPARRRIWA